MRNCKLVYGKTVICKNLGSFGVWVSTPFYGTKVPAPLCKD